jgi:hypothetical protein
VLKYGDNVVDGVSVEVVKRRAKRMIIRVRPNGCVALTIPHWRGTLAEGEAFLRIKWEWVMKARARALSRPQPTAREYTPMEIAELKTLLAELHARWSADLGHLGVEWKVRKMKTRWGVCNWVKRKVTYAQMLACKPREVVEYIVCHELTHLDVHSHGPGFHALMDRRMPDWRERRKRLRSCT